MIEVLRLGHRINRDHRISSHVALVARSLNCDKIYYTGQKDKEMEKSVNDIVNRFGGKFKIEYLEKGIRFIKKKKKDDFFVVHLTCYGLPIQNHISKIRKNKNVFVIVGGEKVPGEIYQLADINLSITNQPHSEVSSLAIFLHEFFEGNELELKFDNSKIVIKPSKTGKNVIKL